MTETTSVMLVNFRLSLRRIFATSRALCSQAALLLASLIDSKSSTCATPTILLLIETYERKYSKIITMLYISTLLVEHNLTECWIRIDNKNETKLNDIANISIDVHDVIHLKFIHCQHQ